MSTLEIRSSLRKNARARPSGNDTEEKRIPPIRWRNTENARYTARILERVCKRQGRADARDAETPVAKQFFDRISARTWHGPSVSSVPSHTRPDMEPRKWTAVFLSPRQTLSGILLQCSSCEIVQAALLVSSAPSVAKHACTFQGKLSFPNCLCTNCHRRTLRVADFSVSNFGFLEFLI